MIAFRSQEHCATRKDERRVFVFAYLEYHRDIAQLVHGEESWLEQLQQPECALKDELVSQDKDLVPDPCGGLERERLRKQTEDPLDEVPVMMQHSFHSVDQTANQPLSRVSPTARADSRERHNARAQPPVTVGYAARVTARRECVCACP
jgi:hypothetical protein